MIKQWFYYNTKNTQCNWLSVGMNTTRVFITLFFMTWRNVPALSSEGYDSNVWEREFAEVEDSMDDQSFKLGFHLKHIIFKSRNGCSWEEEQKGSGSFLKGIALEVFSKWFSGVWIVGHREFAESSSELLSLFNGKSTPSHF